MNLLRTLYLIFLSLYYGNCFKFNTTCYLIRNFLISKEQKFLISFTCFKPEENVRLMEIMSDSNIRFLFANFSNFDSLGDSFHHNRIAFIVDVACGNFKDLVIAAGTHSFYQAQYKWLFIDFYNTTRNGASLFIDDLGDVPLRIDSDFTLAITNASTQVTLFDVYMSSYNNFPKLTVASLSNNEIRTVNFPYEQRKNMETLTLKVAIVCLDIKSALLNSVDVYFNDVKRRNFDTINKVSYNLFKHIQEIHKFNVELTLVDKWFGNGIHGGVDGGLGQLLYEKKIDFSVSVGKLQPNRLPVIDYVAPVYPFKTSFIFRNIGLSNKLQNEFLKPFSASIWFYILGFTLLFCLIFKFFLTWNKFSVCFDDERSWPSTLILIFGVLCQQGSSFVPKSMSGQCTLLSLLIMSLLLYNYYTSSIVSSLLGGLPPPFTTVDELSRSSLELSLEDTPYTRTFFEVSIDPSIKYLYKNKILQKNGQAIFLKAELGIAQVQRGGFAYHVESTSGYAIIENTFEPQQICDLAEINILEPSTLWAMTQKKSQYKKLFAIGYLKMLERGIVRRQQIKWITKRPSCLTNTLLVEVGMSELVPAFMLLFLGALLSIFIFIVELLVDRICMHRFHNNLSGIIVTIKDGLGKTHMKKNRL